jgi:hypothetical protein
MKGTLFSNKKSGNFNLANYIAKMKTRHDVVRFLSSMRHTRLLKFLKFLNDEDESSLDDGLMPLFLEVLSASPLLILTEFLCSIDRQRLYEEILSKENEDYVFFADLVCFLFLKGLIRIDRIQDAIYFLEQVFDLYDSQRFEYVISNLIKETSNGQVQIGERVELFQFMTTIPQQLLCYFRMVNKNISRSAAVQFLNDKMSEVSNTLDVEFRPFIMPDLREVDVGHFVERTFPLAPARNDPTNQQRQCLICHEIESDCESVLRILPCCSARCADPNDVKCVCHKCIVSLSKHSNSENPENRFERGTHVLCPNCRNPFPFFPPNS